MAERLTLKILSDELEQLRTQVRELEQRLEQKIEAGLERVSSTRATETRSNNSTSLPSGIDAEHRQRLIEEEAYLIAERRGFQGGDPAQDWAEAERTVDYRLLQPGKSEQPAKPEKPAIQTSKPRKKTVRAAKKPVTAKKTGAKTARSAKV